MNHMSYYTVSNAWTTQFGFIKNTKWVHSFFFSRIGRQFAHICFMKNIICVHSFFFSKTGTHFFFLERGFVS